MLGPACVDHLVVMAATLDEGVQWCEATFGIVPDGGGRHALMGTHNRLLSIAGPAYPNAYLEIMAIDPKAPAPPHRRWFDMDDGPLRAAIARTGPRLTHFVAAVPDLRPALAALKARGIDRGEPRRASRPTPHGLLQWQITVRADGQRLFQGCLPTLIQWDGRHPSRDMHARGVTLQALRLSHPEATTLQAACQDIGLRGVAVDTGPAALTAQLQSPRGVITLPS